MQPIACARDANVRCRYAPLVRRYKARQPEAELDSSAARAVVAEGRAQLAATGLCLLPDFLEPAALVAMVSEARALGPTAYHAETWMKGS